MGNATVVAGSTDTHRLRRPEGRPRYDQPHFLVRMAGSHVLFGPENTRFLFMEKKRRKNFSFVEMAADRGRARTVPMPLPLEPRTTADHDTRVPQPTMFWGIVGTQPGIKVSRNYFRDT